MSDTRVSGPPTDVGQTWLRQTHGGRRADEAGFVAIAVLALGMVLVLVSATAVALGAVAVVRHRAAAAADLAALAAARHALEGRGPACAAAAGVARAQGAQVQACRVVGLEVTITVEIRPEGRLGELGSARAVARAGPG